ncbi:acetyl-CoA C-acyltransferase [Wenzhouxiangella marina]|uniref:acetyl-CoA C-acyltransferase n=1 Tax=Wenzhouxiangella marina TaxID=1579979 RepID=A0A0K0XXC6_9GAMM|nr:acetyl-CoA C-acyltransferase [Wenzhouxiangella marina]AKS42282.1 Acetyl-CoA acetyltransferase [Wenzhouxiangella marina]MBB6085945.1 acetyl-CoA acyltransferase [Wenzhouxiangella marina]
MNDAYVVAAVRTPVARAFKGGFRNYRPDDLLAHALSEAMKEVPELDPARVEDVIVGCAMPEAEQGMNVARIGALLAGLPDSVPGVTVNRFCSSGLQTIAMAADRIRLGEADVMIAAGTESMTMIPMMGHKVAMNPRTFTDDNVAIAYGMGITAEKVAQEWKVSREDQDQFAYRSHQKAIAAIDGGEFTEIRPVTVTSRVPGPDGTIQERQFTVEQDEGPRRDTTPEVLGKLRTVFDAKGTVTAGTSSQMSDGAAALVLVSEKVLKELNLKPLAVFRGFSVAGVRPEVMGIGPIEAIPKVLKQTGIAKQDLDWIELNEAFAAQALAVMRTIELDPDKVNPLGGAIALGHPLGATGAVLAAKMIHGLHRRDQKYGMVTMCIGTGMGAAGIFERV